MRFVIPFLVGGFKKNLKPGDNVLVHDPEYWTRTANLAGQTMYIQESQMNHWFLVTDIKGSAVTIFRKNRDNQPRELKISKSAIIEVNPATE